MSKKIRRQVTVGLASIGAVAVIAGVWYAGAQVLTSVGLDARLAQNWPFFAAAPIGIGIIAFSLMNVFLPDCEENIDE